MDYKEVIELLKSANRSNDMVGILPKSDISKVIISAMQELQEYKQLGTLEEMKMLKATHFSGIELAKISCRLKQLEKYVDIGTLEEVREAVEKHKWIPCSERLPEIAIKTTDGLQSSDVVLVTTVDESGFITTNVDFLIGDMWAAKMPNEKVIAWQPLPEPYNPERSNT